jgi:hypothetical protein
MELSVEKSAKRIVKETPILFSVPLAIACNDERKTQTRRIFKGDTSLIDSGILTLECPFGNPGDILWVREEHYRYGHWERSGHTPLGNEKYIFVPDTEEVMYSENPPSHFYISRTVHTGWYKRLGRFMPKKDCRIYLLIKSTAIEKLQDISDDDVVHEGMSMISKDGSLFKYGIADKDGYPGGIDIGWPWFEWEINPLKAFEKLWSNVNGPESWNENPYVWVISFKKIEKPC